MTSSFMGIETSKRSLMTQQIALNTTGHNVANANTEGYTRQTVNMVASRPIEAVGLTHSTRPGQLGTGVEFSSIDRIRESFLDSQFRKESSNSGSWSVQESILAKLETIVNEPSESGLRSVIDKFWDSWYDLSENPEDLTARKLVSQTAQSLADAFNQSYDQLEDLQADLTENIRVKAAEMNTTIQTIAGLNDQIRKIEALGDNANDLRDQRDLLVDKLSSDINISFTEMPNGDYQITMGNQELVNGGRATPLTADDLVSSFGGNLTGGEVYGMIKSRDQYVTTYKDQLNTLVNGMVNGDITIKIPAGSTIPDGTVLAVQNGTTSTSVTFNDTNRFLTSDLTVTVKGLNGLHQLGYLIQGATNAPVSGGLFFVSADGGPLSASNIALNPEIVKDASKIASSMRTVKNDDGTETIVNGNKDLAILIAQYKDTKIDFSSVGAASSGSSKGTMQDYFRSIVGQLGVQSEEAQRQAKNAQSVVAQVEGNRQSVSGVSLDEEMSNMIKFQHAYSAAARFMTTIDETLDKLINGTGVVGR
ncbi:flagellar hook-associated protein FlgK [Cohnella sp. AR92]|uniref:flagellar hook-associated protein FlgK n=1 Tax=Cohnella sp. AR92 TaxID=648716 RepID=UPI000F8EA6E1|nr:flagellar hook-associated protein FlgK [Cohnella sp. AR92]RUS42592.1 flagellar hook-associated protein FlgK [Cohnella sp. AR92]